jgi:hypothetical protein
MKGRQFVRRAVKSGPHIEHLHSHRVHGKKFRRREPNVKVCDWVDEAMRHEQPCRYPPISSEEGVQHHIVHSQF